MDAVMSERALDLMSSHEEVATMRVGAHVIMHCAESRPELDGRTGTLVSFAAETGQWTVQCGKESLMQHETGLELVTDGLLEVSLKLAGSALSGSLSVQAHETTDVLFEAAQQLLTAQLGSKAKATTIQLLQRGKPLQRGCLISGSGLAKSDPDQSGLINILVQASSSATTTERQDPEPTSGSELSDLVGRRVEAYDLVGRADLNGKVGTVLSFVAAAGRYAVRLELDGGEEAVRIKPENLRLKDRT
jgi:hypothetical protein